MAADFEFVLKGQEKDFQTGLDALAKMAKTYLNISVEQKSPALTNAKNVTVTAFDGPNPAGNVGVQINHISPINKGETVWTLRAEEVIFIGRLFNTGRVDLTRTIALTGSEVKKPAYCKLKVGALLTDIFAGCVNGGKNLRYINGNVLTGTLVKPNGFLGAHATSLTVIPEGMIPARIPGLYSCRVPISTVPTAVISAGCAVTRNTHWMPVSKVANAT